MRQKVSEPTNGSSMILNASTDSGASSRRHALDFGSPVLKSMPLVGGMSTGEGR